MTAMLLAGRFITLSDLYEVFGFWLLGPALVILMACATFGLIYLFAAMMANKDKTHSPGKQVGERARHDEDDLAGL